MRKESTGKMFHTNLDSSANKYKTEQWYGCVPFLCLPIVDRSHLLTETQNLQS